MLENKIAIGLKLSVILVGLIFLHGVGEFLGNLFLLSDFFTVVGAITVYRFLTNALYREKMLDQLHDLIDIDELIIYLVNKGLELTKSFTNITEQQKDTIVNSVENIITD